MQVPITLEFLVTQTIPTNTLFATECSSLPVSPPPNQPPSSQPSQPPSQAPSSELSVTTPPPVTSVASSSITLSDGQISLVYSTIVSSPPPTSVYVPVTTGLQDAQSGSGATAHLGAILGGSIGGAFVLLLIVGGIFWFRYVTSSHTPSHFSQLLGDEETGSTACSKNRAKTISAMKPPSARTESGSTSIAIRSRSRITMDSLGPLRHLGSSTNPV